MESDVGLQRLDRRGREPLEQRDHGGPAGDHPVLPEPDVGTTNWLFISNNGNLSQFTATDSWIWVVPFKDYSPGQTQLPFTSYADRGAGDRPVHVPDCSTPLSAPLPFGDTFQLQNPVVSGVSVPTVAPGGEFTITGSAFYPFLVQGVVIGGQALSPSSFTVLNDSQIEVVAPNTPGNAQSVVVKTGQGLSNGNVTINIGSPSQVSVQAQPVAAVAGQAFSNVTVATVTDSDPNANPAGFAATIDLGRRQHLERHAHRHRPGDLHRLGHHTYLTAGNYTFNVQVTDPAGNKATSTGTATVSAPNTGGGPQNLAARPVAAVAGRAFTNVTLATFTDSDPGVSPRRFHRRDRLGRRHDPVTTVTATGPGSSSSVLGRHLRDRRQLHVQRPGLAVTGPGNTKATATTTATVTSTSNNGGPTNLVANPVAAVANQAFTNVILGTFTDSDPNANPADFTAAIDWGDGISTASTTVTVAGLTDLRRPGHAHLCERRHLHLHYPGHRQ